MVSWLDTAPILPVKSYPLRVGITFPVIQITHCLGKVTVYLGKRDFIDHLDHTDAIDGVLVVENDYLQGRKIFGQVGKAPNEASSVSCKLRKLRKCDRNDIQYSA